MKNTDNKNKVIIRLAQAYEKSNTSLTDRIESIVIPEDAKLPKELQDVYDSFKNTPLEEPEFYEAKLIRDAKKIALRGLDIDSFPASDVTTLTKKLLKKVADFKDEDGYYKTTPLIDMVKLPRTSQIDAMVDLLKGINEDTADKEGIMNKQNEMMYDIAGVKKDSLSKWEQELVEEMIFGYVTAVAQDTLANPSSYTPFAKYIKN